MNTPTPWQFKFEESGGYDCMTDAFDIVALATKEHAYQEIATIDLSDYGQPWCETATDDQVAKARANAALICRAVNNHEALTRALESIKAWATGDGEWSTLDEAYRDFFYIRSAAEAALALAKEPT